MVVFSLVGLSVVRATLLRSARVYRSEWVCKFGTVYLNQHHYFALAQTRFLALSPHNRQGETALRLFLHIDSSCGRMLITGY